MKKAVLGSLLVLIAGFIGGSAGLLIGITPLLFLYIIGSNDWALAIFFQVVLCCTTLGGVITGILVGCRAMMRQSTDVGHRHNPHACPSCGYDLRGNPHAPCPECGRTK